MHATLRRRHCLQLLGSLAGWAGAGGMAHATPPAAAPGGSPGGRLVAWHAHPNTPRLQAQSLEGQNRSLRDFAGVPLIVNFWASYCAPCQLEMSQFNTLLEQYRPQGLRVLAVNHGEMPARVRSFLHTVPFHGDVLLDRSQTQLPAWGGMALPTSFVLDAQGRVQGWHVGEIDWLRADVQSQLRTIVVGG